MILPLGWGRSIFLDESQYRIYPNMCAKFGFGPTVVWKREGGGTDRQTDRQSDRQTDRQRDTVALYNRLFIHAKPSLDHFRARFCCCAQFVLAPNKVNMYG